MRHSVNKEQIISENLEKYGLSLSELWEEYQTAFYTEATMPWWSRLMSSIRAGRDKYRKLSQRNARMQRRQASRDKRDDLAQRNIQQLKNQLSKYIQDPRKMDLYSQFLDKVGSIISTGKYESPEETTPPSQPPEDFAIPTSRSYDLEEPAHAAHDDEYVPTMRKAPPMQSAGGFPSPKTQTAQGIPDEVQQLMQNPEMQQRIQQLKQQIKQRASEIYSSGGHTNSDIYNWNAAMADVFRKTQDRNDRDALEIINQYGHFPEFKQMFPDWTHSIGKPFHEWVKKRFNI